ncbi:hypothetical protein BKA70DRAFT_1216048 [Coprinopsis sp. MPI-PUGE-AT-0042]|nr:hypothetical protein BKA70DRAFT_1216048 [Coprinopsis sp. MPI-PUGE-AT-0042]
MASVRFSEDLTLPSPLNLSSPHHRRPNEDVNPILTKGSPPDGKRSRRDSKATDSHATQDLGWTEKTGERRDRTSKSKVEVLNSLLSSPSYTSEKAPSKEGKCDRKLSPSGTAEKPVLRPLVTNLSSNNKREPGKEKRRVSFSKQVDYCEDAGAQVEIPPPYANTNLNVANEYQLDDPPAYKILGNRPAPARLNSDSDTSSVSTAYSTPPQILGTPMSIDYFSFATTGGDICVQPRLAQPGVKWHIGCPFSTARFDKYSQLTVSSLDEAATIPPVSKLKLRFNHSRIASFNWDAVKVPGSRFLEDFNTSVVTIGDVISAVHRFFQVPLRRDELGGLSTELRDDMYRQAQERSRTERVYDVPSQPLRVDVLFELVRFHGVHIAEMDVKRGKLMLGLDLAPW